VSGCGHQAAGALVFGRGIIQTLGVFRLRWSRPSLCLRPTRVPCAFVTYSSPTAVLMLKLLRDVLKTLKLFRDRVQQLGVRPVVSGEAAGGEGA